MPGIFGIFDLYNKVDLKRKIQAMSDSLKHEPWFKTHTFNQNPIALGAINLGNFNYAPQPVFNEDESLGIVMHGEIYDYRENLPRLINKRENDLVNILDLFQKKPLDFIQNLNGSFVFAVYNFKRKRLVIANDRYGLRPLYYFFNNHLFIFSSEIKALLKFSQVERKIDDRSIAEFFTFEFILGNKTFFESIKVMPPASILTIEYDQLKMEQYWKPSFNQKDSYVIREEDLEEMEKLICQAVKRQIEPKESVGLFLSGGLDSRTILTAAIRNGYSIPTYTFGDKGCEDEKYAKEVAYTLKCPNDFFQLSPDYLKKWAKKGIWITEGMNNCVNFHGVEILPEIREKSKIMLYGLEGNTWLGFLSLGLLEFLLSKDENSFIKRLFHKLNSPFPVRIHSQLFRNEFFRKNKGLAFESLRESLKNIDYQSNFNRIYHFLVTEKDRRLTILGAIVDHGYVDYRLPFYDYDLVDLAQSIPPKQRALARFYLQFMRKRFSEVASIPYQRTGLPVSSNILRVLLKRGSEIASERLRQRIFRSHTPSIRGYGNVDQWFRHQLKDFVIETLLNKKAKSNQYLNPSFIQHLLSQHLNGKGNHSRQIGLLLTFELWSQLFLD